MGRTKTPHYLTNFFYNLGEKIMNQDISKTALQTKIGECGLEPQTEISLCEAFLPFEAQANEWTKKAFSIVVKDKSEVALMQTAREGRIFIKKRIADVGKRRKELKEDSLRKGQAIDRVAKIITDLFEPIEAHLLLQENFVEIQEEKRKDKLETERKNLLASYGTDISFYDIRNMPDEVFSGLLKNEKKNYEDKLELTKRQEQERIENERMDKLHTVRKNSILDLWQFFPEKWKGEHFGDTSEEKWDELVKETNANKKTFDIEQARIIKENERLKAEGVERERVIALERKAREASEAEEKKQRMDAERLKRELDKKEQDENNLRLENERNEAEEKQRLADLEEEKKSMGDFEKLVEFGKQMRQLSYPEVKGKKAIEYLTSLKKGIAVEVELFAKNVAAMKKGKA